jgi:hypothetical protein
MGSYVLDIYDYYRGAGLIVLVFSVFLLLIRPDLLVKIGYKSIRKEGVGEFKKIAHR